MLAVDPAPIDLLRSPRPASAINPFCGSAGVGYRGVEWPTLTVHSREISRVQLRTCACYCESRQLSRAVNGVMGGCCSEYSIVTVVTPQACHQAALIGPSDRGSGQGHHGCITASAIS
jgi:hypothetical protein